MAPRKKATPLPVGKKIRRLRLDKKIPMAAIANETGCSIERLKAIEAGREMPPVGTLLQISKALRVDSGLLFREQGKKLENRVAAYTKRTESYAYETLTPGAENKHLKAFKVSVEGGQDHTGVGYEHDGEEFVYVLSGRMVVTVGDHENKLKAGDALHFNSGIRHHMKNVGRQTAEMLVVIYQP